METVLFIICLIAWSALLYGVFFGKQPEKVEEKKHMEIVWRKLDEHEQALGE